MRLLAEWLPPLVSIGAVLAATFVSFRVPGRELTWAVPLYLIAQTLFCIVGWSTLLRHGFSAEVYAHAYNFTILFLLVSMLIAAHQILAPMGETLSIFVMLGMVGYSCAISAVVYKELLVIYRDSPEIPHTALAPVWNGAVFVFCGNCALATSFIQMRPAMRTAALCLGIFWWAMGTHFWLYDLGYLRFEEKWEFLNRFIPVMAMVVPFVVFAVRLSGMHMASERVPVTNLIEVTR